MERLTDKKVGNSYTLKENVSSKFGLFNDYGGLYAHFFAVNRLGEIEDILGEEYSLEKLKEMVRAEKEGRCVVLPCKLRDKVFFIENGCVKETEVESFHNWTSGRWKLSTHTDRMFDHWKGYEIDFSGIGKTVFLTREEAEKALERMEKN